jgi:hypothetical protein
MHYVAVPSLIDWTVCALRKGEDFGLDDRNRAKGSGSPWRNIPKKLGGDSNIMFNTRFFGLGVLQTARLRRSARNRGGQLRADEDISTAFCMCRETRV